MKIIAIISCVVILAIILSRLQGDLRHAVTTVEGPVKPAPIESLSPADRAKRQADDKRKLAMYLEYTRKQVAEDMYWERKKWLEAKRFVHENGHLSPSETDLTDNWFKDSDRTAKDPVLKPGQVLIDGKVSARPPCPISIASTIYKPTPGAPPLPNRPPSMN